MGRLLCSFGRQSHASDAAVMASTSAASDIGFRFGVRSALFPLPLPQLIHSPQCATATRPSSLAKLNPNHRSEIVPAISFLSPCKMHHPSLCLAQYRNGYSGHALAAQCCWSLKYSKCPFDTNFCLCRDVGSTETVTYINFVCSILGIRNTELILPR